MKKIYCISALLIMLVITTVVLLRFVVLGDTIEMQDKRLGINMTSTERAFVLNEMRSFLAGIQGITQASLDNDMEKVAKIAKPLGMSVAKQRPKGLNGKLPLGFKQLGFGVHEDFDMLYRDAKSFADVEHTLSQLADVMNKCVACHATYQIVVDEN